MIYYFSATGNSRWIAEQLASISDDIALDIINTCPEEAIQYGKSTLNRKRYELKKYI